MRVTIAIGARTSTSSLTFRTCRLNLSGPAALLGFKPERSFLMPSYVILKESIWGSLGKASFMACLRSCSRDSITVSGEGSEKTLVQTGLAAYIHIYILYIWYYVQGPVRWSSLSSLNNSSSTSFGGGSGNVRFVVYMCLAQTLSSLFLKLFKEVAATTGA